MFSISDEQCIRVATDLIFAGTETMTTTLHWGILYMILNPDIQAKVQKEIHDVIGPHRMPTMKDKASLPYTDACILEIQRMADIAPLGVPHSTTEDVTFRGHCIPKGTMVLANLNSVHRDDTIWSDPYTFNPQRFLNAEKKIQNKEYLIPYSMGKYIHFTYYGVHILLKYKSLIIIYDREHPQPP